MNAPLPTEREWDHVILADTFATALRAALGADDFDAVTSLNKFDPDMQICHSHDFIDANEVMAEAFLKMTGREIEANSDEHAALWNAAWAIFRRRIK